MSVREIEQVDFAIWRCSEATFEICTSGNGHRLFLGKVVSQSLGHGSRYSRFSIHHYTASAHRPCAPILSSSRLRSSRRFRRSTPSPTAISRTYRNTYPTRKTLESLTLLLIDAKLGQTVKTLFWRQTPTAIAWDVPHLCHLTRTEPNGATFYRESAGRIYWRIMCCSSDNQPGTLTSEQLRDQDVGDHRDDPPRRQIPTEFELAGICLWASSGSAALIDDQGPEEFRIWSRRVPRLSGRPVCSR
jgi:hypothetical protein